MELRRYLRVLRRGWLILLATLAVAIGAAAAIIVLLPPTYQAEMQIYVSVEDPTDADDLGLGAIYSQELTRSFVELATSPAVLDPVIEGLGLDDSVGELASRVDVATQNQTVILEVTVSDGDPQQAAAIADSLADSLDQAVQELTASAAGGDATVTLTAVEDPLASPQPASPRPAIVLGLALIAGFALGIVILALREVLDTRIRNEDDLVEETGLTVLGSIPVDRQIRSGAPVVQADPGGRAAESFRTLRTNLQHLDGTTASRSFVITSSVRGEGATSVALNLALSMRRSGLRVLLVDADLRSPAISELLGLQSEAGLTDVLAGRASAAQAFQVWGPDELEVLVAGTDPQNSYELLGSAAMKELLEELHGSYDAILFDAPALLPLSDARALGAVCSGVLLVVGVGRVNRHQLQKALEAVDMIQARLVGLVSNFVPVRGPDRSGSV